ncbi:hypothetical protein D3C80_812470 [compost metagenome]
METVLIGIVGAERRRLLDELAIAKFAGDRPRLFTLPITGRLDAKQVVAAAAIVLTHDRLTPTGFQCGLSH